MRIRLVADATLAAYAAERRPGTRGTQVLELGAAGCSTKEAADLLRVSTGTISTHWQRIFRKTGCRNQREVFFRLGDYERQKRRSDRTSRGGSDSPIPDDKSQAEALDTRIDRGTGRREVSNPSAAIGIRARRGRTG